MNNIKPPFLEYNFYFHQTENQENFDKVFCFFEEIYQKNMHVSLLQISKEAELLGDKNPIGVWTSGTEFSFPFDDKKSIQKAEKKGTEMYKIFKNAVLNTLPDYGAITIEYSMESPCDLKKDINKNIKSCAFYDFYLGNVIINESLLENLLNWCETNNIYVEKWENGFYFSTSSFFNPKKRENIKFRDIILEKVSEIIAKSYHNTLNFDFYN